MQGGAAKLPKGSKVAPLFYRTRDPKMRVVVETMTHKIKDPYIVTKINTHELVSGLYLDCTDFHLNNSEADDYFTFVALDSTPVRLGTYWPLEYFAAIRFDEEWTNKLAGRTYVGFVLFVGDLRQL